jgi:AmiR/NasT family two-component response regulator
MSRTPEDRAGSVPDPVADQTASDQDQTFADRDQTASDGDQKWADHDQSASDSDQLDADADQEASDDDLGAGGDPVTHRRSRLARRRTRSNRSKTSAARDESGVERLDSAEDRDHAADLRDQAAASRDALARLRHEQGDTAVGDEEAILLRRGRARARAAADRLRAAGDRERTRQLRVLVADEGSGRLESLGDVVSGLGHEVVASVVDVSEVRVITTREHPDVALVWLGVSPNHALELIDEIVHDASCPVIALLAAPDSAYVREAAKHGIFAYIVDTGAEELQSAIDITLQRFAEYHDLQGAFTRRAVIEQAKGMLMARHGIDDDAAFQLLRKHSQNGGRRVADVAAAVVDTNSLLPLESHNGTSAAAGKASPG